MAGKEKSLIQEAILSPKEVKKNVSGLMRRAKSAWWAKGQNKGNIHQCGTADAVTSVCFTDVPKNHSVLTLQFYAREVMVFEDKTDQGLTSIILTTLRPGGKTDALVNTRSALQEAEHLLSNLCI